MMLRFPRAFSPFRSRSFRPLAILSATLLYGLYGTLPTSAIAQAPSGTTAGASSGSSSSASAKALPSANWQNLDLQTDGTFGISVNRAYKELLSKGKKPTPVVVAVIDDGIDYNHPDLKGVMWTNAKEIAGNGKDDDKNGYIDDVRGWNFLGSAKGNVEFDTYEVTRLIRAMRPKYGNVSDTSALSPAERDSLAKYRQYQAAYDRYWREAQGAIIGIGQLERIVDRIVDNIGTATPTLKQVEQYQPEDPIEARVVSMMLESLREDPDFAAFRRSTIDDAKKHFRDVLDYNLNFAYDPRPLVGDDTASRTDRNYGSPDVKGPDAGHGTHVAGIIGALRGNGIGIDGIADAVRIIPVRTVPSGDERDKDVANAIRYAVDNGAKVINMSFGKAFSPDKAVVDDAVKYAMSKDVLIVHAAGNDGENVDSTSTYPNRKYLDGGTAAAWLEVGASSWANDSTLVPQFSNYGGATVDVFAPGAKIRSTVPNAKYEVHDGTSMAAPVVTGIAALIRSRYPQLSAVQVKEIIMKSVTPVTHDVMVDRRSVPFSSLCISGGIVNAYNALTVAAQYASGQSR